MKNINTLMYRDDDVNVHTCFHIFKEIHKKCIAGNQLHVAAVIMKDLWENQGIFYYLAIAPLLEVGLHGWEHKDYSVLSYEECYGDLKKSLDYWNTNLQRMLQIENIPDNKRIKIFFAPWNREGENIRKACADLGLKFCNVQKGTWGDYNIKSFHWWSYEDTSHS